MHKNIDDIIVSSFIKIKFVPDKIGPLHLNLPIDYYKFSYNLSS